jgi:putative FmdB family regulatory protein
MPLFEYRCRGCQGEFELLVRNGEPPACPRCEGADLERLLSAPFGHGNETRDLPIVAGRCEGDGPPCSPGCCRL